jgi:hypothetical protein
MKVLKFSVQLWHFKKLSLTDNYNFLIMEAGTNIKLKALSLSHYHYGDKKYGTVSKIKRTTTFALI